MITILYFIFSLLCIWLCTVPTIYAHVVKFIALLHSVRSVFLVLWLRFIGAYITIVLEFEQLCVNYIHIVGICTAVHTQCSYFFIFFLLCRFGRVVLLLLLLLSFLPNAIVIIIDFVIVSFGSVIVRRTESGRYKQKKRYKKYKNRKKQQRHRKNK